MLESLLLAGAKWWEGRSGVSAGDGGEHSHPSSLLTPCLTPVPALLFSLPSPSSHSLSGHSLPLLLGSWHRETTLAFGWSREPATKPNTVAGFSGVLRRTALLSLLWFGSFFSSSGCHPAWWGRIRQETILHYLTRRPPPHTSV